MRPARREPASQAGLLALVELLHVLSEYREGIVLVGGWVPELAFPDAEVPPVGTIDIDLALDPEALRRIRTKPLGLLLREQGYRQAGRDSFRFEKDFRAQDQWVTVKVDLLTSLTGAGATGPQMRAVQDVQAHAMPGFQIAFHAPTRVPLSRIDAGADPAEDFRIVSPAAFLVLKGLALKTRSKAKDPCDIHYCLEHYSGGVRAAAEDLRPLLGEPAVREALRQIDHAFASPLMGGALMVAREEGWPDDEQRAIRQRVVQERVASFLRLLGVR